MKTALTFIGITFYCFAIAQTPDQKIVALGVTLPQLTTPVGSYVDAVRINNLLYLSGKGPRKQDGTYITGKVGGELNIEQGSEAAKLTAVIQLAVLKQVLGSLDKVKRIVKVNGFVNSESTFSDQPKVINGFSNLMIEVFGEKGKHARTAVGVNALPFNMAVEVEMIVEIE